MWNYVFSPRLMLIDAAVGLAVAIFFLVRHPGERPKLRHWFVIALAASLARHAFLATGARAMPSGYVGEIARVCMKDETRERCLCAIDALRERIGQPALVRVGVRAEVNQTLPPEVADALVGCRE